MPVGLTINGKHSYSDYGLYIKDVPDKGSPAPQISTINIPGSDGVLDLTEVVTGEVKYGNRIITVRLGAIVNEDERAELISMLMDDIHGRICKIVFDDDLQWYYRGRAEVEIQEQHSWRIDVVLTFDAEPYKMRTEESNFEFDSGNIPADTELKLAESEWVGRTNSNFIFGTAGEGINLVGWDVLSIRWTNMSKTSSNPFVQVIDVNGNLYQTESGFIDPSFTPYNISMATLTNNGVDVSAIRRVLVSGIGDCVLYVTGSNKKIVTLYNDRKTVVPTLTVGGTNPVTIYLNGKSFSFSPGVHNDLDFTLKAGKNELVIYGGDQSVNQKITLTYRTGRL